MVQDHSAATAGLSEPVVATLMDHSTAGRHLSTCKETEEPDECRDLAPNEKLHSTMAEVSWGYRRQGRHRKQNRLKSKSVEFVLPFHWPNLPTSLD